MIDWSLIISFVALAITIISSAWSLWIRTKDEIESRPYIDVKIEFGTTENPISSIDKNGHFTLEYKINKIKIINYGRGTARNFRLDIFGNERPIADPKSRTIIFHKKPIYLKYVFPSVSENCYIIDENVETWGWLSSNYIPTYIFCTYNYEYMGRKFDGLVETWDKNAREKTYLQKIDC